MDTDSHTTASDSTFRCSHCDMTFSKKDHLTRHIRAHTNQRPYACSICAKRFSRSDVLRRHTQLHSHPRSADKDGRQSPVKQRRPRKSSVHHAARAPSPPHRQPPPYPSPPTNDSPHSVATPSPQSPPGDSPSSSITKDEHDLVGVDILRSLSHPPLPPPNGDAMSIDPQHLSRSNSLSFLPSEAPANFFSHPPHLSSVDINLNHHHHSNHPGSPSHPTFSFPTPTFPEHNHHISNSNPMGISPAPFTFHPMNSANNTTSPSAFTSSFFEIDQTSQISHQPTTSSPAFTISSTPSLPPVDITSPSTHSSGRPVLPNITVPSVAAVETLSVSDPKNQLLTPARSEPFTPASAINPFLADNNNIDPSPSAVSHTFQQPSTSPWAAPLSQKWPTTFTSSTPSSASSNSDISGNVLWQSSLLDFSSLFSSSSHHYGSVSRPHSPASFSRLSQEERVKTIWPTRPFRKQQVNSQTRLKSPTPHHHPSRSQSFSHPARSSVVHPNFNTTANNTCLSPTSFVMTSPDFSTTVPRPEIDGSTAARMGEILMTGSIPFDQTVPSPSLFNRLLDLYFVHCHPVWPFLHPPTFHPSQTSPVVLLNMVALGGLYCNSPEMPSKLPVAISRKMHEILTFSMSPALHHALDETERDALQLCQACMLRQLFGLLGGDRESLESAQIFHSSVVNVARRAGLFAPEPESLSTAFDIGLDLDTKWRQWASKEVRKRTAFCFVLNDMSFAALFLTPPYTAAGAVMWPLPDPDIQFEAQNAMAWKAACSATPKSSAPFYDLAPSLFLARRASAFLCATHTSIGRNTLLTSIVAVVLATRANRPTLENDLLKDPSACAPLAAALMSALGSLPSPMETDTFSSGVLWELAWIHLLTDVKMAELANGREGIDAAKAATDNLRRWSCTPRARRAILHCAMVVRRVDRIITLEQDEVAPHVYTALFQAWMVLRTFIRLNEDGNNIYIPKGWIEWPSVGSAGLSHQPLRAQPPNGVDSSSGDNKETKYEDPANLKGSASRWIWLGEAATSDGEHLNRVCSSVGSIFNSLGKAPLKDMLGTLVSDVEMSDLVKTEISSSAPNQ